MYASELCQKLSMEGQYARSHSKVVQDIDDPSAINSELTKGNILTLKPKFDFAVSKFLISGRVIPTSRSTTSLV